MYPTFCLTEALEVGQRAEVLAIYRGDELDARMARASAEVEGQYYGKLTRVEETLVFARKIGAKKIGIATCIGLIEETRTFARFLKLGGLDPYAVLCKVGSIDKTEIGIPDAIKVKPGNDESCCNPILQAMLLNRWGSDLNVLVGLCVGHDSLFIRHSEAPVTTLIAKDRALGHNPAVALYTSHSYCKRLFDEDRLKTLT
jgi:uncharacterized metal-binding protein